MNNFTIVGKTKDGRDILKVPEEKWLLKEKSELQTICRACGKCLRFFEKNTDGGKASIPNVHAGSCNEIAKHNWITI